MSCATLKHAANDLSLRFHGAGVYVIQTLLHPGAEVVQHVHKYDHLSIIPRNGRVELMVEGEDPRTLTGPCSVVIEAGKKHSVRALTPVLWQCIHRIDGEVVDEETTEREMRV